MKVGGMRDLVISPDLGYGQNQIRSYSSELHFDFPSSASFGKVRAIISPWNFT